jgi:hypothetical protein
MIEQTKTITINNLTYIFNAKTDRLITTRSPIVKVEKKG